LLSCWHRLLSRVGREQLFGNSSCLSMHARYLESSRKALVRMGSGFIQTRFGLHGSRGGNLPHRRPYRRDRAGGESVTLALTAFTFTDRVLVVGRFQPGGRRVRGPPQRSLKVSGLPQRADWTASSVIGSKRSSEQMLLEPTNEWVTARIQRLAQNRTSQIFEELWLVHSRRLLPSFQCLPRIARQETIPTFESIIRDISSAIPDRSFVP
jgi:hypothetical protein